MSKKDNVGFRGNDGSETRHKGESQQNRQQGAPGVRKDESRHRKDESHGAEKNTTKKGPNSI